MGVWLLDRRSSFRLLLANLLPEVNSPSEINSLSFLNPIWSSSHEEISFLWLSGLFSRSHIWGWNPGWYKVILAKPLLSSKRTDWPFLSSYTFGLSSKQRECSKCCSAEKASNDVPNHILTVDTVGPSETKKKEETNQRTKMGSNKQENRVTFEKASTAQLLQCFSDPSLFERAGILHTPLYAHRSGSRQHRARARTRMRDRQRAKSS